MMFIIEKVYDALIRKHIYLVFHSAEMIHGRSNQ